MTIRQLQSLQKKKQKELNDIYDAITLVQVKKAYAQQKKKIGKCYRSIDDGSDSYYRIIHVSETTAEAGVLYFCLYTDPQFPFECHFETNGYKLSFDDNAIEISKEEWDKGFETFLESLVGLSA